MFVFIVRRTYVHFYFDADFAIMNLNGSRPPYSCFFVVFFVCFFVKVTSFLHQSLKQVTGLATYPCIYIIISVPLADTFQVHFRGKWQYTILKLITLRFFTSFSLTVKWLKIYILQEYARSGLRTLCLAVKHLDGDSYDGKFLCCCEIICKFTYFFVMKTILSTLLMLTSHCVY